MSRCIWIFNHYATDVPQAGANRHYYFAKLLVERGYKVRIFTASTVHNSDINLIKEDEPIFKDVEIDNIAFTYIKTNIYKGNGVARIKNMLGFAFSLKKIWKKYSWESPNVIYASSPDIFTIWQAEKIAKKHKLPCLIEIRDLWPLSIVEYGGYSAKNPAIIFLYRLEKRIYKKADAIIFTMEGGRQYIRDKGWNKSVNINKVFNVNNGIDCSLQDIQCNNTIVDNDLDDDTFKVIYAGSIRVANSIDLIINAAEVLKDYSNIKFIIYGDGDDKALLEQVCESKKLKNVLFKGRVSKANIPYILTKASINVLTYKNVSAWKYGGSQNKQFDYLNAGKPIITNIKMGYSLLERYACGIEANTDKPEIFADAILKIYNMSSVDYDKMCRNAKSAAKDFDYEILTDKLEEAIQYAVEHYRRK